MNTSKYAIQGKEGFASIRIDGFTGKLGGKGLLQR